MKPWPAKARISSCPDFQILNLHAPAAAGRVELRPLPFPWKAMLVICSDLDETSNAGVYLEMMKFMNTLRRTSMGLGAGLEVGNSIYFDMPQGKLSYWNASDADRHAIRALIRSGHIDCLHSYGDLATTRSHAAMALDELDRHGCKLRVWVDHGRAATNFGAGIMHGHGDVSTHQAYHADLTIAYGIRFVWRGRVTSVIGQDVPASLAGLWSQSHPIASARTISKEAAKRTLARHGSGKYSMHAENRVLRTDCLRDGTRIYEFMRSNPHWRGVSSGETAREIAEVLTRQTLGHLVERGGVCILYTHLGKEVNGDSPFPPETIAAFRRLADAYRNGDILITTTSRALNYLAAHDNVKYSASLDGRSLNIDVQTRRCRHMIFTNEDLSGLTFYVPRGLDCRLTVDGRRQDEIQQNRPDDTGRESVSIPWRSLEYPDL